MRSRMTAILIAALFAAAPAFAAMLQLDMKRAVQVNRGDIRLADVAGLAATQKRSGLKRSLISHLQGASVLAPVIGLYAFGAADPAELANLVTAELRDLEVELLVRNLGHPRMRFRPGGGLAPGECREQGGFPTALPADQCYLHRRRLSF